MKEHVQWNHIYNVKEFCLQLESNLGCKSRKENPQKLTQLSSRSQSAKSAVSKVKVSKISVSKVSKIEKKIETMSYTVYLLQTSLQRLNIGVGWASSVAVVLPTPQGSSGVSARYIVSSSLLHHSLFIDLNCFL